MARSRAASLVRTRDVEYREIEAWYRDQLERTVPPANLRWEPMRFGPTWQWSNGWVLPEATLGWDVLSWCGYWLRDAKGRPWQFTMEQARFVLWFHSVAPDGSPEFHSAVLQRLKGWGKDPLAATAAAAACFGPTKFDHWDGDRPVGTVQPNAWVQCVAVSQEQTKNTMKLFPSLISPEARKEYGVQVGKVNVYGLGDTAQIEAVTSSVMAIEGGRPTLIIRNETQNWKSSNGGHDMAGAIEGNAAKSEGGAARMLDICNAFRPGEDSVGERVRDGWNATQGENPTALDYGLMYDSLEAPPDAPLTAQDAPDVVAAVAGDATWLDVKGRILKSILNPSNPASESRRKWYNQITATEESWADPQQFGALQVDETLAGQEEILLFLDCSKNDDATAMIGCRCSDGLVVEAAVWQRPPRVEEWQVDRDAVVARALDWATRYTVRGFWADPSDTRDDDTGERFWDKHLDELAQELAKIGTILLPAVRDGDDKHLVIWDMRAPRHQKQFVAEAERTATAIETGSLHHTGGARLIEHVRNARRRPGRYGVSLGKEHRESRRKVDAAVAMVGVRLMWRMWTQGVGRIKDKKQHNGGWWA